MSINTASSDSSGGGNTNTNLRSPAPPSRYESQKRRDWNTFGQYLKNHRPPLALSRCSGAHVLEFLRYLDQFGKTKVHLSGCPFFGHPNPPAPCPCPLRQAWGSLDALIGRLRAAFEENGGQPETNPFGARAVRLYLREVRDAQSKARGIAYEKKKRKKVPPVSSSSSMTSTGAMSSSGIMNSENLRITDLNNSVSGSYQMNHVHHGHVLFNPSGEATGTAGNSTGNGNGNGGDGGGDGGGGGGDGNGRGGGLFGGPDERLLLFQCSSGSLM